MMSVSPQRERRPPSDQGADGSRSRASGVQRGRLVAFLAHVLSTPKNARMANDFEPFSGFSHLLILVLSSLFGLPRRIFARQTCTIKLRNSSIGKTSLVPRKEGFPKIVLGYMLFPQKSWIPRVPVGRIPAASRSAPPP